MCFSFGISAAIFLAIAKSFLLNVGFALRRDRAIIVVRPLYLSHFFRVSAHQYPNGFKQASPPSIQLGGIKATLKNTLDPRF